MNTYKTAAQIRAAVKTIWGSKNARVTRNGEIHVRGRMPNTIRTGWYLLGFVGQDEIDERLWLPDGRLDFTLAN